MWLPLRLARLTAAAQWQQQQHLRSQLLQAKQQDQLQQRRLQQLRCLLQLLLPRCHWCELAVAACWQQQRG
jgi:hypothetical protein